MKLIFSFLLFIIYFGILFLTLFTVAACVGKNCYICDILSNFKFQYFFISIVFFLIYILFYKNLLLSRIMLIPLSLCLLLNGFDVLKWFNPNQIKVNENSAVIKIALSNVWKVNKKYDKLLEFVKNNNPDILVLQEVNARWLNNIKSLDKSYKYKTVIPRNDNFGIAVYSKKTLNNVQIIHSGRFKKPIILFNVNFYGKKVNFAAIHPTPPKNKVCFDSRNYQLNQVVDWIKSDNKTAIIVGDLNLSIFSPYYKQMIDDLSMLNSRKGNGLGLSWPTLVPKFFRIPIDQILHTSDITTIDFQMGSNIGSDHLPVIAVLKIK